MASKNKIQFIPGIHSVKECIGNNRGSILELWMARGKTSARIKEIIGLAQKQRIPIFEKDSSVLDSVLPGTNHQGIAALIESFEYTDFNTLVNSSGKTKGRTLFIAVDHITDEGNLGAILRTAAFFGVHGIILPKDRSAKVSGGVIKMSSGGYAHVPVSLVVNLGRAIDTLNEAGFWIIGTSGTVKETIYEFDWRGNILLVLGNEEKGVSPSILKRCHQILKIPSNGSIDALNVSVATGIILSEITRQHRYYTGSE
ncbi:MAG: 23S rRNA (guanosine(2251)-2'-O)-methyltransferase RlmB [Desulfobacteraceae bacterium]